MRNEILFAISLLALGLAGCTINFDPGGGQTANVTITAPNTTININTNGSPATSPPENQPVNRSNRTIQPLPPGGLQPYPPEPDLPDRPPADAAPYAFTMTQFGDLYSTPELDDASATINAWNAGRNLGAGSIVVRQLLATDNELSDWRDHVGNDPDIKQDAAVILLDEEYEPVGRYCLQNTWPSAWWLSDIDGTAPVYEYYRLEYESASDCYD